MKYLVTGRPVTLGRKTYQKGSVIDSRPTNMGRSRGYDAACQVLASGPNPDLEVVLPPKEEAKVKAAAAIKALEEAEAVLADAEAEAEDEAVVEDAPKPKRKRRTKAEIAADKAADELQAQSQADDVELARMLEEENDSE